MCGPLMVAKIYNESQEAKNPFRGNREKRRELSLVPLSRQSYQVPTRSARPIVTVKLSG